MVLDVSTPSYLNRQAVAVTMLPAQAESCFLGFCAWHVVGLSRLTSFKNSSYAFSPRISYLPARGDDLQAKVLAFR